MAERRRFVDPEYLEGVDPSKVLFLGMGATAICWYRCAMPAMFLGADWLGVLGEPPDLLAKCGMVGDGTSARPPFSSYDVIVVQQPRGQRWLGLIRRLQEQGVKVIYEIDDYVHAIHKMPDHEYREDFTPPKLRQMELCMRVCDAMIVSTEYLARRFRKFNPRTIVCENGLDTARYRMTLPERPTVNIGWAGATAHERAMRPWLRPVGDVMTACPDTCFVSIGHPFADYFHRAFPNRAMKLPFTMIDLYPAAMTLFDVALAPAGVNNFFRGKSDLRWLEAGALGIPVIADPHVYPKIRDGEDGFHAHTPEEMMGQLSQLVQDGDARRRIGQAAKERVYAERDMPIAARQWARVIADLNRETPEPAVVKETAAT